MAYFKPWRSPLASQMDAIAAGLSLEDTFKVVHNKVASPQPIIEISIDSLFGPETSQVSFVLLMILLLSALTVADIDTTGIMILCTICASLIITGLSVAAGYLLLQHFLSKLHKQYAFFLCHHRALLAFCLAPFGSC